MSVSVDELEAKGWTHVLYDETQPHGRTLDVYSPEEDRCLYSGLTLQAYRIKNDCPNAVPVTLDEAVDRDEAHWTSEGCLTTRESWDYAMNVLPPQGWYRGAGCEFFHMSERLSGRITTFFVRIGEQYVTFDDKFFLAKEEVLAKARRVLEAA